MKGIPRTIVAIALAGLWINASEFLRNEVLLKTAWTGHYRSLGMIFPSAPLNGAVWVTWGFLLAGSIHLISRRFSLLQTTLISWLMAFVMMWVVIGNLGVLPFGILPWAVPLSLLETFIGSCICIRLDSPARH